jgi:hypothetical protein
LLERFLNTDAKADFKLLMSNSEDNKPEKYKIQVWLNFLDLVNQVQGGLRWNDLFMYADVDAVRFFLLICYFFCH